MKKITLLTLLVLMIGVAVAACSNSSDDKENKKVKVYTTVYPLTSFVEQIGGKHVEVKSIYPAGTDLHNYEPTQKDILKASKADFFVYTGKDLDPVAKKVASTIKDKDKKLSLQSHLKQSDLITEHDEDEHDHEHDGEEHHHGKYDPHIWLDPVLDKQFSKNIKDKLIAQDPKHKKEYEQNYKKLAEDLTKIDEKLTAITKDKQNHVAYISHDSIGYLAKRYGFKQKGVQNMNAEDPSQKDLTKIVQDIKSHKVKYILLEDNVSTKVTDTVRKETEAKPVKFNNMESLSSKQLKEKDITYQSIMKKNIESLEKALQSS
ncbi:zinc ABC transporter substrate-binding protein [Staphylococcus sp. 27_4_6_LY]|nr:zinc ABC transporter substrate-binding protein [Staphylococcus durrellii]